jgi:dUTP pyrophosphatase
MAGLEVKFKKLHMDAVIPPYASKGAAGLDLTAVSNRQVLGKVSYFEYDTGIAMELPPGYVGLLFPRSSISKTGMRLLNSVGVIDSDYRGEIKLRFSSGVKNYRRGDRIGQLVIMQLPQVSIVEDSELSGTDRGTEGFGSTGE